MEKLSEELHGLAERGILVEAELGKGAPHEERRRNTCRRLRGSSPKATRRLMSWQKAGAMLDEGFVAEAKAEAMKNEREQVYAALLYAASFHCLVEQLKDCEELTPKPKEKLDFRGQQK